MCDPVLGLAIASFALSAGTAAVGYIGQNQQAKAAGKVANLNYARERDLVGAQSRQIDQAQSEEAFDTAITRARAQGDIAASASVSGLAPNSIAAQVNQEAFGLGRNVTLSERNRNNQRLQLGTNLEGADLTRQSTIANNPKASAISLALGVGKAGVDAATSYKKMKG